MLSFKKGRPIAIIKGGKQDGKIIRITDSTKKEKCCDKCSQECKDPKKKCCFACSGGCLTKTNEKNNDKDISEYLEKFKKDNGKSLTTKQLDKLELGLKEGIKFISQKEEEKSDIVITDGELIPLFTEDKEQIDRILIYGVSGSGKSTLAGKIIAQFLKDHKDYQFILFSKVTEDKQLDKYDPLRIPIDNDLVDNPITDEELKNTLIVFDDVEREKDKKIKDALMKLRDHLAENGRHFNAQQLSTMHQLDYRNKDTRVILNEATGIAYFPKSGDNHSMNKYLKGRVGLCDEDIKKINNLPSRWIFISRWYPQCIIYEKGVISLFHLINKK
jgi:hypothetical protein